MKTKTLLTTAILILLISGRVYGQADSVRKNTQTIRISNSHSSSRNGESGYSYEYNYDYSYDGPSCPILAGIKASANFSGFVISPGENMQSNMMPGVSFGGFIKFDISKYFAMQYELMFNCKASELENMSTGEKQDYRYWGMELPIYFIGQIPLGTGKIFAAVGPYVSLGFDAVYKPGDRHLYDKDDAAGKRTMNRWDVGAGAMLGYQFGNGIILSSGYQFGGLNIHARKNDYELRNGMVNLSIAYGF